MTIQSPTKRFSPIVLSALMLAFSTTSLYADGWFKSDDDDFEHGRRSGRMMVNSSWQTECSECHIVFPPAMLPVDSWRSMMKNLDNHFGSDASLDQETSTEIQAFLESNAGHGRSFWGKPRLRITESRWFVHEHDEIPRRIWNNPKIQGPADCSACHTSAAEGDFDEHRIRIPH